MTAREVIDRDFGGTKPRFVALFGVDEELAREALDRMQEKGRLIVVGHVAGAAPSWMREHERIFLSEGESAPSFRRRMWDSFAFMPFLVGMRVIVSEAVKERRVPVAHYQEIYDALMALVDTSEITAITSGSISRTVLQSVIGNLDLIAKSVEWADVACFCQNLPAVCVASGPSLDKNIHLLPGLRKKALFFACDSAVEPLLHVGIVPDFVSCVDSRSHTDRLFGWTRRVARLPLLCAHPSVSRGTLDNYHGPKLFVNAQQVDLLLNGMEHQRGPIVHGTNVGQFQVALAIELGCPIVALAGQDFAFARGRSHAARAKTHQELTPDDTVKIPGWDGNPVETSGIFLDYLHDFEAMLTEKRMCVYNCTEGGAFIRGTAQMRLLEFMEHIRKLIPAVEPHWAESAHNVQTLGSMRFAIRRRIAEVENFLANGETIDEHKTAVSLIVLYRPELLSVLAKNKADFIPALKEEAKGLLDLLKNGERQ